jgi:hypothetical protein
MQLFLIGHGVPSVSERIAPALAAAAGPFPGLAAGPVWTARSKSGTVTAGAIRHPDELVGPRSYLAEDGDVAVLFDGLPVHRTGRWPAHDASTLMHHWDELAEELEGQFTAVRIDFTRDEVSLLTDSLGIAPVFRYAHKGGYLVSNSVEAIRVAAGLDAPSPLGVSTFLAMGWSAADATLLHRVHALPGGTEFLLDGDGLGARGHLTPETVVAGARSEAPTVEEAAGSLVALTSAALGARVDVKCALTGGRDTRLLLALIRAADAGDARYYTIGVEGEADVDLARRLAGELGLRHEVWPPPEAHVDGSWRELTKLFVSQSDGLSSLIQIGDYADQLNGTQPLAIKFGGLGGEVGRAGVAAVPYATNVPFFAFSRRIQEMLLLQKAQQFQGLWTAGTLAAVETYLHRFVDERRAEGWSLRTVNEAFYTFDRVARWGSTNLRRTSATDDLFSPFCSKAFIRYCFSLSPGQRYTEAPHRRILTLLEPELRDMPFESPWRQRNLPLVPLDATYNFAKVVLDRGHRKGQAKATDNGAPYWLRWFEAHAADHRELCLGTPDSPLWDWINRDALEKAFAAGAGEQAGQREGLARAATLFWYFHGRGRA